MEFLILRMKKKVLFNNSCCVLKCSAVVTQDILYSFLYDIKTTLKKKKKILQNCQVNFVNTIRYIGLYNTLSNFARYFNYHWKFSY